MYILVVSKNKQKKNLCNIVINIDIIICKVFYSVIGFKAMFLCLPVKYCKQTLGEVGWVWDGCGREGSLNRLACHWLVWKRVNSNLTGCHLLLSAVISLLLWVCIRHYVYTVGQSTLASLQHPGQLLANKLPGACLTYFFSVDTFLFVCYQVIFLFV